MAQTVVHLSDAGRPARFLAASRVSWFAVVVLAALLMVVPRPAAAHGGDLDVSLGTDGAGGVSALLTWVNDGHPVEESAEVVVTALSDSGDEVGPLTLASASGGVGWYASESGLLEPGHWTLEAEVSGPAEASVVVSVDVLEPPTPAPAVQDAETDPDDASAGTDPDAGTDAVAASGSTEASASTGWTAGTTVIAVAVAVAVLVTALLIRARRARS